MVVGVYTLDSALPTLFATISPPVIEISVFPPCVQVYVGVVKSSLIPTVAGACVVFIHDETVKSSVPLGSEYESATTICPVMDEWIGHS